MDSQGRTPTGRIGGGKRIPIDHNQLRTLASMNNTQAEIAAILGIAHSTLEKWLKRDKKLRTILDEGHLHFRSSIRQAQYKQLKAGSVPMLIFLGKNYLGQKDKQDFSVGGPEGQPIEVVIDARASLQAIIDRVASRGGSAPVDSDSK